MSTNKGEKKNKTVRECDVSDNFLVPPEEKLSNWEEELKDLYWSIHPHSDDELKEKRHTVLLLLLQKFIKQKFSYHNARLIERVNNRLLDEDVNDHLSDDQIGYVLQIIKEEMK